jgi:hypothetical protein
VHLFWSVLYILSPVSIRLSRRHTFSSLCFARVFPETLRVIVGDGSIPPPRINRPVIPVFTKYTSSSTVPPPPPKKFLNPLRLFTHPSVILILLFNGMVYSVFYAVTTTMSSLFADAYPFLTESEIGLCFLAVGVGCGIGSYTNGQMLDADYRRTQRKLDRQAEADAGEKGRDIKGDKEDLGEVTADFPIEYARLRGTPIYLTVFVLVTIGYAWSIQRRVHISCPLIMQFIRECFQGSVIPSYLIPCSRLDNHIHHEHVADTSHGPLSDTGKRYYCRGTSDCPSSISALIALQNNLVRCTMGATLVSIIDFILAALLPGWTFVLLCALCVLMWPMSWAVIRFGPRWRERRNSGEKAKLARRDDTSSNERA